MNAVSIIIIMLAGIVIGAVIVLAIAVYAAKQHRNMIQRINRMTKEGSRSDANTRTDRGGDKRD